MSEQEKLNKKFGMVAMPFHFHFQKLFTVLPDILARNQCKKWNKNLNLETLWIMMGKSKEKGNYFVIFCPPQKLRLLWGKKELQVYKIFCWLGRKNIIGFNHSKDIVYFCLMVMIDGLGYICNNKHAFFCIDFSMMIKFWREKF